MLKNKKFKIATIIILIACLCLLFLNNNSILLATILILLALVKHNLIPIRKEMLWYLTVSFGGALTEILLVNLGEAWSYTSTHFFNIPIWMPLFWGVVGTTVVVLYDGFVEK